MARFSGGGGFAGKSFQYHNLTKFVIATTLKEMNVSLTPELETFVQTKVSSGRYTSASEVVREALRLLVDQDQSRAAQLGVFRSWTGFAGFRHQIHSHQPLVAYLPPQVIAQNMDRHPHSPTIFPSPQPTIPKSFD